jgi:hypothetical protein
MGMRADEHNTAVRLHVLSRVVGNNCLHANNRTPPRAAKRRHSTGAAKIIRALRGGGAGRADGSARMGVLGAHG